MAEFQLTDAGLETPRLPEARELAVQLWKARFGENAQTDSDSPDGLIIDDSALLFLLLWEACVEIFNSAFFRTSGGNALSLVLDMFGKERLQAQPSSSLPIWWGDPASAIPFGSIVAVEVSGNQFSAVFPGTLPADVDAASQWMVVIGDALVGETYTITIDATPYAYTVLAGDGITEVIEGLRAALSLGTQGQASVLLDDGVGYVFVQGVPATLLRDLDVSGTGAATIDRFVALRLAMQSVADGPINALAGSLTDLVNPVAGIEGVINMTDASLGRLVETDAEFRERHLSQLQAGGLSTPDAIRGKVLTQVATVEQCRVFENTSALTVLGRPPHSIEVVTVSAEGADDEQAILQAVWDSKAGGIEAFGSVTGTAIDTRGDPRPSAYTPATRTYLWLEIDITPGEGFPASGDPQSAVAAALVAHFGRGGPGELIMGLDFYRFQAHEPINESLAGIASAVVRTATSTAPAGPPGAFTPVDVVAGDSELVVLDTSRITVAVL